MLTHFWFQFKTLCISPKQSKKKKPRRKIIYFNPPYCQSVRTNIGKAFLQLEDKNFKEDKLNKIINRKKIKIHIASSAKMVQSYQ